MIAWRRARAHATPLVALALVALLLSGLVVGIVGGLSAAATSTVREQTARLRGADGALRVSIRVSGDGREQDLRVRALIARTTAGAPVDVIRTLGTNDSVDSRIAGHADELLPVSIPGLSDVADLTAGEWPASAGQVAVQADAAKRLDLHPGSALRIGSADLRVSALWRAVDGDDPRWLGDPLVAAGHDASGDGPVVVDPSAWKRIGETPLAQWTIVPDATRLGPDAIAPLRRLATELPSALRAGSLGAQGVDVEGGLGTALAPVALALDAMQAILPIPLLVLAVIAAIVVVELARGLAVARAIETGLLRARGASVGRVAVTGGAEALVVAAVGSAIGAGIGVVVVSVLAGPDARPGAVLPLVAPAVVALGIALLAAGVMARSGATVLRDEAADRAGRGSRTGSALRVVLVVVAAALACWRLISLGGPLPSSGGVADPIAVLATPVALLAVALAVSASLPVVARAAERIARGASGARPLLARAFARSTRSLSTATMLVALAVAAIVLAGLYSGSWATTAQRTREARLGADVVATGIDPAAPPTVPAHASATPVDVAAGTLNDDSALTVVGVAADALPRVASDAGGTIDLASAARSITVERPGASIPDAARHLVVAVHGDPVAPVRIELRVLRGDDTVAVLASTTSGAAVALPTGSGRRLLAVDAVLPSDPTDVDPPTQESVIIDAITPDVGPALSLSWVIAAVNPTSATARKEAPGLSASVPLDPGRETSVRFMATSEPAPAAISSVLAEREGLRIGSTLHATVDDAVIALRVARIVPVVPGSGDDRAVLVDLAGLRDHELRGGGDDIARVLWWLRTADPATVARRMRAAGAESVLRADDSSAEAALAAIPVALGAGAGGAILLALVAGAAVLGAESRTRAREVAVLRALGLTAADQAAQRRREFATAAGTGLVGGAIGGAVAAVVLVPPLVHAALLLPLAGVPVGLVAQPSTTALGLVALVVGLGAVALAASARVASAARTAVLGESAL